jgi:hypothetical protein
VSMIPDVNVTNSASKKEFSGSFDKEDLRKLFKLLQERLDSAAELEVANYKQNELPDDQYQKNKETLRNGYKLLLTITGANGQRLYGTPQEILSSPNYPETIESVYINSAIVLKARENWVTRNSIEMFLDFSHPAILDFRLMPSGSTPNGSNFTVQGADATWVNGIFRELETFVNERTAPAPWLHRHTIYDLFLWVLGFPIAFWICFKASSRLPAPEVAGGFVRAALLVYIFLLVSVGFRTLFHYCRWVFPVFEYRRPRNRALAHRVLLGAITVGLITSLIYDVAKWAVSR